MRLTSTIATLAALALPAMTVAKPIDRLNHVVRDQADSYDCKDDQTLVRTLKVGDTVSTAVFSLPSGTSCTAAYQFALADGTASGNHAAVATPSPDVTPASGSAETTAVSSTSKQSGSSPAPPAATDTPAIEATTANNTSASANTTSGTNGGKRHVAFWDAFDFSNNASQIGNDSAYFDGVTHLIIAWLDMTNMPTFSGYVQTNFDNVTGAFLEGMKTKRAASGGDLKVMMSLGGWGFEKPFQTADPDKTADGLVALVKANPWIDGFDIDWEYPTLAEAPKFQQYITSLRKQLDAEFGANKKIISIDLPGAERDIKRWAYSDKAMMSTISGSVDFFNLMTYDILNREDTATGYHASLPLSKKTISAYSDLGIDPEKMNVGFAMYAKVFNLAGDCASPYLDCPLQKLQTDPTPDCAACGVDLKQSIALRYNTVNNFFPEGYADEDKWQAELEQIIADSGDQNSALKSYVPDEETNVWVTEGSFWSWQSPYAMGRACSGVLPSVGGIMSWAIGQDTAGLDHFKALQTCIAA